MQIDIQHATPALAVGLPDDASLRRWAAAAVEFSGTVPADAELSVRIVGEAEMVHLNATYRGKAGPTNVLSFPFDAADGVTVPLLGDLVSCAPVVAREAREQGKPAAAHWAHMVIPGALHLLGYDHLEPDQAARMEGLEIAILENLGYPNP
ncbi:MAG: rRNA maturation RNase YbeY, partial [Pseudomonadota bacterium]